MDRDNSAELGRGLQADADQRAESSVVWIDQ